jgi:hypothetical protein
MGRRWPGSNLGASACGADACGVARRKDQPSRARPAESRHLSSGLGAAPPGAHRGTRGRRGEVLVRPAGFEPETFCTDSAETRGDAILLLLAP